jgi:manganese oxidase
MNRFVNRRNFLKFAGVASAALGLGAASQIKADEGVAPAIGPVQQGGADDMDAMHEKGVKFFLDNIGKDKDFWGVEMPSRMEGQTRIFDVECTEGQWQVSEGQTINAMLYNGRVPGPIMRVKQGENVRINVTNKMTQSTAVHFHGVHTPNGMDGVPFVTQPLIKSGATFTYEFAAKNSGSHMYHSHHNAAEQVTRGLFGAFIIDPAKTEDDPKVAADYVMVLNDAGVGMTINGRSFPSTQPIIANKGDKIRIRYMNEGLQIHPMHLHGMYQTVIAKDGAKLSVPYLADTLVVAPGERYDVLVDCEEPGAWAFHCHILSHAESAHGMFGMVTALVIK